MSYQGHLPDGSSVQKHSAGSCYPFVVYGQETPKGLRFGIIAPKGQFPAVWTCAKACELADAAADLYRKRQAKAASIYVAATDSVVQVPLNIKPPLYPDGWGVV